MDTWHNSSMSLFLIKDGEPQHMQQVGIRQILWDMTRERVCAHCGSVLEGNHCSNCGSEAPPLNKHSLGQATVTLVGILPFAMPLFHLPNGSLLELCHICPGLRSAHSPETVIMRFINCRQVDKYMPDVSVLCPEEQDHTRLLVDVKCVVEMYAEGMTCDQ